MIRMNKQTRRDFVNSLCLLGAATSVPSIATAAGPEKKEFRVFDGLLFSPMPDLRDLGMPKLLSAGNVWRPNVSHDEVDPTGVVAAMNFIRKYAQHIYFDLELWPISGAPQPVIDASIRKVTQVLQIARRAVPDLKFGVYDEAPRATYWPIVLNKQLEEWHGVNKRLVPIANDSDYLFPSLYTFYDDPKGWDVAARGVLKEARMYGKPVYPFLWPQYHDSNVKLTGIFIPGDAWRRQLELCREAADGIALWGGFRALWDEEAPWWVETKDFMRTLKS
jgi:hypothetical protein